MEKKTYIKGKTVHKVHGHIYSSNMELLDEFSEHIGRLKFQPTSIIKYRDSVMKFFVYLRENGIESPQNVTLDDLLQYRHSLNRKNYSEYSVCAYLRQMRAFFNFLEETGRLFDNPATRLVIGKPTLTLGHVLSESEVKRLLAAPDISTPLGLRDRAVLEVLYATGVRREELLNMTLFNVDTDRQTVRIVGKGRKERILPMGKHAAEYVKLYLKNARPQLIWKDRPPTDALWISRNHKPLSKQRPHAIVKDNAVKAGLSDKANTHTLRRSCATHMLRNGAHPMMVSTLLGHAQLKTLSHYLKISVHDMMKAHAKTRPGH